LHTVDQREGHLRPQYGAWQCGTRGTERTFLRATVLCRVLMMNCRVQGKAKMLDRWVILARVPIEAPLGEMAGDKIPSFEL